jgi:membrane protease YdiL (CAAX protease family)
LIVLLPLLLRATSGATLTDLGFGTRGLGRNVLRGLVACALTAPVCYGLMKYLSEIWPGQPHPLVEMLIRELNGPILALAVVSAVVLAPVFEELVFRGILLGWMAKVVEIGSDPLPVADRVIDATFPARQGVRGLEGYDVGSKPHSVLPNVVSSLLFALLHSSQWPAPIPLFGLALVLGALARRTGSLWASMTLHAAFNGLSTILLVLGLQTGRLPESQEALPPSTTQLAQSVESCDDDSRNLAIFALGGGSNLN